MLSPTVNLARGEELLAAETLFMGLAALVTNGKELDFFIGGGAAGSDGGALRLRNSTMIECPWSLNNELLSFAEACEMGR